MKQSIKRGLREFSEELCLEALRLHEEKGYGAKGVVAELLPNYDKNDYTYAGDRLIDTGRYIRDQRNKTKKP